MMITKHRLPSVVAALMKKSGQDVSEIPELPLRLLQSGAFELEQDSQIQGASIRKTVVIGGSGRQGVRTSGAHVNIFALAGGVLSAATAPSATISAATALLALMGACSVSLSGAQAAFFLASHRIELDYERPTASNLAKAMSEHLNRPVTTDEVVEVAKSLHDIGVPLKIDEVPNEIVRHEEWVIVLPGF